MGPWSHSNNPYLQEQLDGHNNNNNNAEKRVEKEV